MHILLIEDNEDDVELIRHYLTDPTGAPYTLDWTDTCATGLTFLQRGGIDILLLDLSLPDSHGMKTFMDVHTSVPSIPVVVLTGLEDDQLGLQMVEQGAQDFLVKGQFDSKLLSRTLRYALERSRSEQTIRTYSQELETKNLELREAWDKAMEASRIKSRFLATISHEFRTPMNGVIGLTDLLLDTNLTSEQKEYAELVRQSANTLFRILNDILEFTQIEQEGPLLTQEDFDLEAAMQLGLASHADQAREKGLQFESVIQDGTPHTFRGDPEQLGQVLSKLVENAVKFTKAGTVGIHVTSLEETATDVLLRFSITDTGIGIPPEKRAGLFHPFNQVDNSSSRSFDGMGLSLAICKKLMEKMGGAIGFSSEEGCGSEFWFTVRLAKPTVSLIESQ